MGAKRWRAIAESQFPHEREALEFLRTNIPDRDPWRAWSNFEFIDDQGKVNEVDALVLSPRGLFLVEIKSWSGSLSGDTHSWTLQHGKRPIAVDNPLRLANRKAKRLASLLARATASSGRIRIPFINEVIFLSHPELKWTLDPASTCRTFDRGNPGRPDDDGIVSVLADGLSNLPNRTPIDAKQAQAICQAVETAGIKPSLSDRRIGDFQLGALIAEGEGWQDWEATHLSLDIRRRIRLHPFTATTSDAARQAMVRITTREFQILEGVDHPGILKVRDFKETDRGPALMFDHDPNAFRFDLVLNVALERLSVGRRLNFLRQLGETLKYAHEKGIYHRALAPQNILTRDVYEPLPRLQIMNWQTGVRDAVTGQTGLRNTGTEHLADHVEDPALVYVAPEAFDRRYGAGPHHDVFSLGAIAYHLFAGQPPAATPLDLVSRLNEGEGGLLISSTVDGACQELVDLIRLSTHPDVSRRLASIDEFLDYLADAERELRRPPPEITVDPAEAAAGDRIAGGFTVEARLGRGASADALLVRPDGSEESLVLKVGLDPSHNERLRIEGLVLSGLRHPNIVSVRRTLEVAGRTAILMERAGDHTLAQRLRGDLRNRSDADAAADTGTGSGDERLSLDLVQRFGEELLGVVDYLEQHGVAHRDIKPENIGIAQVGQSGKLQLVLFDFSLARTPTDNIRAGTRPYLDPFLSLRRPPRWDLHAERFAATITLYEMLTATAPAWGDGVSAPDAIDDEATIEPDLFDPDLREGLTAFFTRALRRDPRERFDNAEEMLRSWRLVFDAPRLALAGDDFERIALQVTATTSVAELGYGREALDVLDGLGIHTVRDLLAAPRRRLRYLTGVGDRIRREIREKAKRLAGLRKDLRPTADESSEAPPILSGLPSIDQLADGLLPKPRVIGEHTIDDRAVMVFLGLEPIGDEDRWPVMKQVSSHCGMSRSAVANAIGKGRERWKRQSALTDIRRDIAGLLDKSGGVMTLDEVARQLLLTRGSTLDSWSERRRHAAAVIRAALEVEAGLEGPRFELFEETGEQAAQVPLLATQEDLAVWARALGRTADALASRDPSPAPNRVQEDLTAIRWPRNDPPPPVTRLLTLAVAASQKAALSARQEIYPRGMPAERALRMALGSLMGPQMLSPEQIRQRVAGRYPEAEPLPGRPGLDALLDAAGAGRAWDIVDAKPGYYSTGSGTRPSTGTGPLSRHRTDGPPVEPTPQVQAAELLEERFAAARRHGGFLALTVEPRRYLDAERALLDRFPLERLSFDRLMLDALRTEAKALNVDWSLVLRADAADRHSRDWTNLRRLIDLAWPKADERLRGAKEGVLLVDAGLFARYALVDRLQGLRDCAGSREGPTNLWLLLPLAHEGLPMIGDQAVPIIGSNQWARIPESWVANAHRAGKREPLPFAGSARTERAG